MILNSIKYSQFKGVSGEWVLEKAALNKINLIVGKNASGKSRTVNIVSSLGKLLSGKSKPVYKSSNFEAIFEEKGKVIKYNLYISDSNVTKEELTINDKVLLKRGKTGKGKIFTSSIKEMTTFQTPITELTSSSRRDSIQHPFFEDLHTWSTNMHIYRFASSSEEQMTMLLLNEESNGKNLNEINGVLKIFKEGKEKYGHTFIKNVLTDMKKIGYDINSIDLGKPNNIESQISMVALAVKEKDVEIVLNQTELSTGMFRALSLIIQINYYNLLNTPSCFLIDDVGEGLDFERSTNLINLLIEKAENSEMQLIMSTNDRFVMNCVPLKYWSLIQRKEKSSVIYNYKNSKKIFDKFEYTGLNNFDFFSKNFFEGK